MRYPALTVGALLGGLTTLPVMALFYFGGQVADLPFLPFALFDWLARVLPGDLVTVGIDLIVALITRLNLGATDQTAKLIEKGLALGLVGLFGLLFGTAIAWGVRRTERTPWTVGLQAGLLASLPVVVAVTVSFLSLIWVVGLLAGWGALLGYLLDRDQLGDLTRGDEIDPARRSFLRMAVAGSLGIAFAAWGLGRYLGAAAERAGATRTLADLPPAVLTPESIDPAALEARIEPVPGTRPELTPTDDFYRIDINLRPPRIGRAEWELAVEGLVDDPRTFTLEALMAFPAVTQAITLSCISNPVGGDLIGTSFWTGLRLRDLLEAVGLQPAAQTLTVEAEDGFFETVEMADMMDPRTLLVYGMNGETLSVEHGFPLRIYIPDRYGMKQPKWITRIAAVGEDPPGYWVERGWSREARPRIVSVIDTVAIDRVQTGMVPVGGIAWAGDRGIETVEVQVDEGAWQAATLRTPELGPLTWTQWRYDWPATPGPHTLRVRATDGNGDLQVAKTSGVRPDGATGYHERTIHIDEDKL